MIKKLIILSSLIFLSAGFLQAQTTLENYTSNIGKDVYGVFGEFINGAKYSYTSPDVVKGMNWGNCGWGDTENGTAYEGKIHWNTSCGGAGGWGIGCVGVAGSYDIVPRDMSVYYGGTLELYIRSAVGVNIGNVQLGISIEGGDKLRSISSLAYVPNGQWQKIVIPLDSTLSGLTKAQMVQTRFLFMVSDYAGGGSKSFDIDYVVWKMPGVPSDLGTIFKIELRNRVDDTLANKISWSNAQPGISIMPADQYVHFEMLNYGGEPSIIVQVYTDNTSPNATVQYTGSSMGMGEYPNQASGMVGINDSGTICPMLWRCAFAKFPMLDDNLAPAGQKLYDGVWRDPWTFFKDSIAPGFVSGYESIVIWSSQKGAHLQRSDIIGNDSSRWGWGEGYGSTSWFDNNFDYNEYRKFRLYFAADLQNGKQGNYVSNSIVTEVVFE